MENTRKAAIPLLTYDKTDKETQSSSQGPYQSCTDKEKGMENEDNIETDAENDKKDTADVMNVAQKEPKFRAAKRRLIVDPKESEIDSESDAQLITQDSSKDSFEDSVKRTVKFEITIVVAVPTAGTLIVHVKVIWLAEAKPLKPLKYTNTLMVKDSRAHVASKSIIIQCIQDIDTKFVQDPDQPSRIKARQRKKFEESCFGILFVRMHNIVLNEGIIHNIIARQAESMNEDIMEFNFNGNGAIFTRKEFVSYNATLISLHKALDLHQGELNKSSTYSLGGFPLAFQLYVIGRIRPLNADEKSVYKLNEDLPIAPFQEKRARTNIDMEREEYAYFYQQNTSNLGATSIEDVGQPSHSSHNYDELKSCIETLGIKIDGVTNDLGIKIDGVAYNLGNFRL
ncbi:hypothetical protein FNV43_RR05398 [Rhamnella rubrinervis]|uniref:Uncharacterized protein n=1 Tax=Rhamnella rubrinervis TaxID=2594499 RepID=A0A8K0HNN9_9ROSA|nr:hypothetical protein FNV43_RR05398 [Rhamnella rubrinervis]